MLSKQQKSDLYRNARTATGCSQNEWARIFNMKPLSDGGSKVTPSQANVSSKENGGRGVNYPECLASELLRYMYEQEGLNVKRIQFNGEGQIISVPKR